MGSSRVAQRARADEAGSSTAEFAVLLPVLVLLMAAVLAFGTLAITQVQLKQGARAAARELARGQDEATARAAGTEPVWTETTVSISRSAGQATAQLTTTLEVPLVGARLITLDADATARTEARHE